MAVEIQPANLEPSAGYAAEGMGRKRNRKGGAFALSGW